MPLVLARAHHCILDLRRSIQWAGPPYYTHLVGKANCQSVTVMQELKDELADISKACDTGPERLLDHIYKAHPPQDPSNKQPVWSPDGAKDALKTAIAHYSSDLAQNRHEVNTGTVLQEEIRKALTAKYFIFSPAC